MSNLEIILSSQKKSMGGGKGCEGQENKWYLMKINALS